MLKTVTFQDLAHSSVAEVALQEFIAKYQERAVVLEGMPKGQASCLSLVAQATAALEAFRGGGVSFGPSNPLPASNYGKTAHGG